MCLDFEVSRKRCCGYVQALLEDMATFEADMLNFQGVYIKLPMRVAGSSKGCDMDRHVKFPWGAGKHMEKSVAQ